MRRRSGWAIVALSVASAGAYAIAWLCQTRDEMNRLGARIPSPWWLVTPVTALYWAWCWAEGVRHVTAGRLSAPGAFGWILLGPIGMARVQASFNALADRGRPPSARWYRPARSAPRR